MTFAEPCRWLPRPSATFPIESATLDATLADSTLTVADARATGPAVEGHVAGTVALAEPVSSDLQYELSRVDLSQLRALTGNSASAVISTTGHLSGPADALHAVGDATINQLDAYGVRALTLVGHYDAVAPTSDLWRTKAQVNARGTFLTLFGQSVNEASGTVTMDADRLGFDLDITQQENRHGRLAGAVRLRDDRHAVDVLDLTVSLGRAPWRLTSTTPPPVVSWDDDGMSVTRWSFPTAPTINGLRCRARGGVTETARSASPGRTSFSTRCKTRSIGRRAMPARWTSTRPCAARSSSRGWLRR
jgi:hypothetical protein